VGKSITWDESFIRRFWAKVNKDGPIPEYRPELGPCWLWTASLGTGGYGQIWTHGDKKHPDRRLEGAHRVSHQIHLGDIPERYHVDHLCRVRPCVRYSHLEAVTHQINIARGLTPLRNHERGLAQTHCRRAHHEYTPENTYMDPKGNRRCRKCRENERLARMSRAA
jgi:hypothetical protein